MPLGKSQCFESVVGEVNKSNGNNSSVRESNYRVERFSERVSGRIVSDSGCEILKHLMGIIKCAEQESYGSPIHL
jgi:hypothetical protein